MTRHFISSSCVIVSLKLVLDYLFQYFSDVSFWFHSGLYQIFFSLFLIWHKIINELVFRPTCSMSYIKFTFYVFICAKHTIIFLLKVLMFLYISRINIVRSIYYIYVLALIRYNKVPSNIKGGFNQYAGNFSLIWCTHTHTHRNAYFSISVC